MKGKETIVTFCCSTSVHVYLGKTSLTPSPPCKFHSSISEAKRVLKDRGVDNPKVITQE